ncbi:preprotein translocase subunit SecD [Hamadaea flava]|uniref:SecDF P1 head subdomain domain-containing protein n=1 Tax=Hamadaea flava TaxID=1742688 RepID=A0ABV8LQY3_9ACTN|nr:hypothetical protein [Hamadaea flava]MCP2322741.1 preprotein translocase subunit SecD [Hamadaea flava]
MMRARVLVILVLAATTVAGCSLPFGDKTKTRVTLSVSGDADHSTVETILRNRVTGAGMPKPGFAWTAEGLVMTVPGDRHEVDFAQLTAPGVLEFRKVVVRTPASQDCGKQPKASPPGESMIACDADGVGYGLDVAKVVHSDVASATYQRDQTGQQTVLIKFTGSGQAKFTDLSREAVGNSGWPACAQDALGGSGNCLVAIVLDNKVISAPEIISVLTGDAVISGSFTEAEAERLASVISAPQLPVDLTVAAVTVTQ